MVCVCAGFKEKRQVKILFEEAYYGDEQAPLRLLVLERCLVGGKPPLPPPPPLHTTDEYVPSPFGMRWVKEFRCCCCCCCLPLSG